MVFVRAGGPANASDRAVGLVAREGAQFGCARMVDAVTRLRGARAATFLDADEARRWLLAAGPPEE